MKKIFLFLFVFLLTIAFASAEIGTGDIVMCHPLNDASINGTTSYDYYGNYSGTITGTVSPNSGGEWGNIGAGATFSGGTSYISVTRDAYLNTLFDSGEYTMIAWINATQSGRLWGFRDTSTGYKVIAMGDSGNTGKMVWYIGTYGATSVSTSRYDSGGVEMAVFVLNSSQTFFHNTTNDGIYTPSSNSDSDGNFIIGAEDTAGSDGWQDTIRQFALFNRRITTAELDALFNSGDGTSCADIPPAPPAPDTAVINVTNVKFRVINDSGDAYGDETYFNTGNVTSIEKVRINYSIESTVSLSTNISVWFTANGTNACALGNRQDNICYADPTWVNFKNNTITPTFDGTSDGSSVGEGGFCNSVWNSNFTNINVSCTIDEHYNPNVAKHYDALFNMSDIKLQDGASQRLNKGNILKLTLDEGDIIPINADLYKLDFRVNVSSSPPIQPLQSLICNSSYTTGNPEISPNCILIGSKLPEDLTDDGTKYRTLITQNEIEQIGLIDSIVLTAHDTAASRYYALQTFKATASPYDTQWNYSTDSGATYTNLGDGYESTVNVNWFNDGGINNTHFIFKVETEDDNSRQNSSVFGYGWTIDATFNLAPIIDIQAPDVDERIGSQLQVNWTVTEPNNDNYTVNITLIGASDYLIDENISKEITNNSYNLLTLGVADGRYNLTLYACENETTDLLCSSHTHEIEIDNTNPVISTITPENSSSIDKALSNLSLSVTCTDVSPFYLNATMFNSTDTVFSLQNNSPEGTELKLLQDIDLSNVAPMEYTINYTCADTHTKNIISDIPFVSSETSKWIKYDYGKVEITIQHLSSDSPYVIPKPTTIKYDDKYTFSFQPKGKVLRYTHTFELTSTRNLHHIPDSGYNGHFVSGGAWVDFDNNDPQSTFNIVKMDDKRYRIAVTTNDLNFESTGYINIFHQTETVTITETTEIGVNATSPANNTDITTTNNVSFFYSVSANSSCDFVLNETINNSYSADSLINNTFTINEFNNGTYNWQMNCTSGSLTGSSENNLFNVGYASTTPAVPSETFDVLVCPDSTSGSLNLWLIVAIAFVFILIGFVFKVGIFGFFGALMLFVASWYISPCLNIFGLILALVSLFMALWFAITGLGFAGNSFRQ